MRKMEMGDDGRVEKEIRVDISLGLGEEIRFRI